MGNIASATVGTWPLVPSRNVRLSLVGTAYLVFAGLALWSGAHGKWELAAVYGMTGAFALVPGALALRGPKWLAVLASLPFVAVPMLTFFASLFTLPAGVLLLLAALGAPPRGPQSHISSG